MLPLSNRQQPHEDSVTVTKLNGRISLLDADLDQIPETQVAEMIEDAKKREVIGRRMVRELLVEPYHYDFRLEEDPEGQEYERPFLKLAGAQELRKPPKYHVRLVREPIETFSRHFVNITVEVGVYTASARLIATGVGSCNSKDALFLPNGQATYKDARQVAHPCLVRATQRAEVLATREAFSLTAVFANPDEHRKVFEDAPLPKNFVPWTEAERQPCRLLALELGIKKDRFRRMVCHLFSRPAIATGEEAAMILEELRRIQSHRALGRYRQEIEAVAA